ncbi:MAG: TonB family protein [Acidobacteriota bacterium]
MSWREGVLLSLVLHLAGTILLLLAPQLFPVGKPDASEVEQKMALMRQRENDARRFVFVQPRAEFNAKQKPKGMDLSDRDRATQSPERAPNPMNLQPFSKGNTQERIDQPAPPTSQSQAAPDPSSPGQPAPGPPGPKVQDDSVLRGLTGPEPLPRAGAGGTEGDRLGDAIRNAQRYAPPQIFDNSQGGGQFGSALQFDTKGVEFGPWVRRFIAQIKRNWFIPYAAMALKGHVVVTFVVHKDGSITELGVAAPSGVDAFNNSSFNAIASSNPTQPLPPEYPDEKARFTITFYYNEPPPDR